MEKIKTPKLPSLVVNGTKDNKYVLTYENIWDKTRAMSIRGKSHVVGKFVANKHDPSFGEVFFNDEFKDLYPELNHFRVFRHKGGKLEFKLIDCDNFTLAQRTSVRQLHGGASWALNQIVGQSGIGRALAKVFPDRRKDQKLLSLIYFLILEQSNAMYNYEQFSERTWLPYRGRMSSSTISRLFASIRQKDIEKFLKCLIDEKKKSLQSSNDGVSQLFLALDSTSISSMSSELSYVEYGHNKDLITLPQVNVLLIVDQKDGLPLYYRTFDGNVPDCKTIRNTLADFARLEFTDNDIAFALVSDKGYISEENIADCLRNNMNFVFNTRVRNQGVVKELVEHHYSKLLDVNNYNTFLAQSCITESIDWEYDPYPVQGKHSKKKAKAKIFAHIYYNKRLYDEQYETLVTNLSTIKAKYKKDPTSLSDKESSLFAKFMTIKDGEVLILQKAMNDYLQLSGVRVLLTDCINNAPDCYQAYEDRNKVEYAFNTLKSRLACNRLRVHDEDSLRGKMFIQIIATALARMIRSRIMVYNDTAQNKKNDYRVVYDSDEKLLAKLNNIMVTSFRDGWYFAEVTGRRKTLFEILGVKVPSVEKSICDDDKDCLVVEEDGTDSEVENLTSELL